MTPKEREVLEHLVNAWNSFCALPVPLNDRIANDFADAIHRAQYVIALYVAGRVDPDVWVALGQ